ncbi:DUF2207 domain-containing protein [Nocardioides sp. MAH-18]|uniref:DUF2207 domain-containing protein n=1 Tax=Nocardioides agri TaxID=2682843 RepID=A0A6L6XUH6_9ACTN|nr:MULTISPECIES: DUF2207 domain-containing protein [unclassified Nocardioides]MBA2954404.1 DUF2207 domain-containing protein [Nocardioides sp. CGMCC 1.13656]MVQ49265.1 DUF2207 domain-containing protein [Nocardioides sp. MAH-18]
MKRLVGRIIGLAVVVLVLLVPATLYGFDDEEGTPYEPTSITSYLGDFTIGDDGDMDVVETITVDFPSGDRHGIFRFFDEADADDDHVRWVPRDISVTMDGDDVPVAVESQEGGRYTVARIGDADVYVDPGQHVYEISYTMDGVLREGTSVEAETEFYWNLIPGGWLQTIDDARLTVHLPAAAEEVRCAVGTGATDGCDVRGEGTTTLQVRAESLPAQTPVTVQVGLDMPTPPAGKTLPWAPELDQVLGTSIPLLAVILLLAAGAAGFGVVLARRSREADPQFPLMYAPPEGIGPAQAAYLVTEQVDEQQYVATLLYAAERGAITLDRTGEGWTITDNGGPEAWAGLDPVTSGIAHVLSGPGTSFTANADSVEDGKRMKAEIAAFESSTKDWASGAGLMARSGLGGWGTIVIGACVVAVLGAGIFNPFGLSALGLIPGLFAVFGIGIAASGAGTKRTRAGRDVWSRAGGFRRILSTPSAQDRFDFSGREELYTAYVPWAVAFGCADQWAAKYRIETGSEPPVPSYLGHTYAGVYAGSAVSSMVSDFSSTVSSAISSYEATQQSSSSSGGGGGFSGGGGGGGGGGGSW